MKQFLPVLAFTALSASAQSVAPAGGGSYLPTPGACLTPTQHARIDSMLDTNIRTLTQRGILPGPANRPATVPLSWPLRQAAGFSYNSIYGISNFVDRNAAYPNQLLDWNCGTRTYDTAAGYNHGGLDVFLWPFDMNMMASGQAEIVAATAGVIIAKSDGNFDMNCAFNSANWNAVYVQNADGSVCWYGHMKSGSLTTKAVGASVAQGEFLGTVGSSGSSTGPHLHFEVHAANGTVIDPYAGTCSPGATSWATQKPYYEPTINTLMTHSAPPVLATCPAPHTPNTSSNFAPGARIYLAAYYHDQQAGQLTTYTVYRPDNTVFATWTHSITPAHYAASYWYWNYVLPTNAPVGNWRFTATFQGSTVTQNFTVGIPSATAAASRQAAFTLYPNPARRQVTLELAAPPVAGAVVVRNQLGQVVSQRLLTTHKLELALPEVPGLYLVTLPTTYGPVTQKLLVE
ncbi:peptidoglycan DD-metalloendopeptidase family protein [Hymenobacter tibetensis]|uniref:Peptidoglycan DD-metalloendopeptidase family protein n=1 Tax=Hymenobacter tibetensis TaxID=497967 RepID=A0ABY4D346_9BACT|nr:peptidoglycan DD-metalloendopeptidase family protein [Hymenobacter tibetensis]UOG76835.1 peptidoglycan DD-metalloendopeptidase family protein [Hymenobacter tibetensis]